MSAASHATHNISRIWAAALACLLAIALSGCLGDESSGAGSKSTVATSSGTAEPAPTPPAPAPPAQNSAPKISGSPPTTAKVNQAYSFQPVADDPEGDKLAFSITNRPAWATFDVATGRLSGTPSSSYTGTFADIRISVSDGQATSSLNAFTISVAGADLGSATLRWQAPTSNTDGSPLTNLAGYIIRYGTELGSLSTEVRVANPGLTTYVVSDLEQATWYFQVSAYNSSGVESAPSATASKTIT
jgi:hypothetical protein